MDVSSTASSFYEAPVRYDEMRTSVLYEQVAKDFKELREAVNSVQKNMTGLQQQTGLTVKLINQLQKFEKEKEKEKEGEGQEENQSDESQDKEKSKRKDKGEKQGKYNEEQEEESDI